MSGGVFCGNPEIYTERLLLRRYRPEDAEELFYLYSKPEVSLYTTWETYETREDIRMFITDVLEMYDNDETGEWGVVLKETGALIGSCGFTSCDTEHSCAQTGFLLDPDYWGRGLMTEAVRALLDFGFGKMNLNRIEGFYIPGNEASGRVMEKASMRYEGTLREKLFFKGSFHDLKLYAALRKDYNQL